MPEHAPKTKKLLDPTGVRAFVREDLIASPMFPKLYADVMNASAPDSHEANILASNYKKIIATTERTSKPMSNKSCTHIKVSGVRCGSPALRGEEFCYFHQRMLRTVRGPASRVHHAALLEDDESIQASLIETVNALLQGTIELKRAELVLRALNTAVRNIRRVHFGLHPERMIKEVPEYATPPLEQVDEGYAAELRRREQREKIQRVYGDQLAASRAASVKAAPATPANAATTTPANAAPAIAAAPASVPARSCGDGSLTRPGGPEVPGRSAPPPKPDQTKPAEAARRKPPVSVREYPTSAGAKPPKERQIVAHRGSSA